MRSTEEHLGASHAVFSDPKRRTGNNVTHIVTYCWLSKAGAA